MLYIYINIEKNLYINKHRKQYRILLLAIAFVAFKVIESPRFLIGVILIQIFIDFLTVFQFQKHFDLLIPGLDPVFFFILTNRLLYHLSRLSNRKILPSRSRLFIFVYFNAMWIFIPDFHIWRLTISSKTPQNLLSAKPPCVKEKK